MRTGIVVAVLGVIALAIFNPGIDQFRIFVADRAQTIILEETGEGVLGRALSGAGANLAGQYVDRITERDNYVLFSTYTIDLDGGEEDEEHWTFLGLAGQFLELERPPSVERAPAAQP
jgi:hypothetical protein